MSSSDIYGLYDPRQPMTVENTRYVGKTTVSVQYRLRKHLETARRGDKTYRGAWIRSLLTEGAMPVIIVLESVQPDVLSEAERRWIAHLRKQGCRLANGTDGGSGGDTLSPAARERRSEAMRQRWADPEYRQRMSDAHKGIRHPASIAALANGRKKGRTINRPSGLKYNIQAVNRGWFRKAGS